MESMISGTSVRLRDLGAAMNKAVSDLYRGLLDPNLRDPADHDCADFERAALDFFDRARSDPHLQDSFLPTFRLSRHWTVTTTTGTKLRISGKGSCNPSLNWEGRNPGSVVHT